ncbi:MAG: DUF2807 domain-containing protein [Flavobacteriaceae bacterium]|nr:DUF2807 domain-containing protein [Flavobacteriaceae bacterium]
MFTPIVKLSTVLILSLYTSFSGCQNVIYDRESANTTENVYDYSNFDELDLSHAVSVNVVQSDTYKVVVSCNEKYQDDLRVVQNNSTLKIKMAGWKNYRNLDLKSEIHLPSLKKLQMSGASRVVLNNLKGQNMTVDISGASSLKGNIDLSNTLEIDASGASRIQLEGVVKNADVDVSGASSVKGLDLVINDKLRLDASGASNAKLIANGRIKADLSGASSFKYGGDADKVNIHSTGASSSRKL